MLLTPSQHTLTIYVLLGWLVENNNEFELCIPLHCIFAFPVFVEVF